MTADTAQAVFDTPSGNVKAELVEDENGWRLLLSRAEDATSGARRLVVAGSVALRADAAIGRLVSKGRTVELVLPHDLRAAVDGTARLVRPYVLPIQIPDDLYRYQRDGTAWLLRHRRGILADDMGLGKTAQSIGAIRRLIRHARATWVLVVAPTTLLPTWYAELNRWAPELVGRIVTPEANDRTTTWKRSRRTLHVAITSYEHLRTIEPLLSELHPDVLIADEAHRLRNKDSQTSIGFREIQAERTWLLTGTPVENDAQDMATLMAALDPGRFGGLTGTEHINSLRANVRPLLLRRTKQQVLPQLPPVIESDEILELSPKQRGSYNAAILSSSLGTRRETDYLRLFNVLRGICDIDPVTGSSSKLERAVEIIHECSLTAEKLVVFSYLLDPLTALQRRLDEAGLKSALLTGRQSKADRGRAIDRFKTETDVTALLASMRVASEGLTLTEASTVVFLNRWWNPSANSQARDRVVRIGQERAVRVVTFTCRATVEERLPTILEKKAITFDRLVNSLSDRPELFGIVTGGDAQA